MSDVVVHDVRDGRALGQTTLTDSLYATDREWIDGRTLLVRYEAFVGDPMGDQDRESRLTTLVISPGTNGD